MAAYEEHCAWVRSLRQALDVRRDARRSSLRPSDASEYAGRVGFHGGLLDEGCGEYLAEVVECSLEYSELEEPVFRGLHNFGSEEDTEDLEVGHEPPIYRSFGVPGLREGFELEDMINDSHHIDADWLVSMPPLVCRQNACSFGECEASCPVH